MQLPSRAQTSDKKFARISGRQLDGFTPRQPQGDSSGEHASGAVRIARFYLRAFKPTRQRIPRYQAITANRTGAVAAFHQHSLASRFQETARSQRYINKRPNTQLGQRLDLRPIWCNKGCPRQQGLGENTNSMRRKESRPAGGAHHRIDDQWHVAIGLQRFRDSPDGCRSRQQAGFDRAHRKVRQHGFDLRCDQRWWGCPPGGNPAGVLRGDRRNGRERVAAQGVNGAAVRLNARAGPAVGARDGQHARRSPHDGLACHLLCATMGNIRQNMLFAFVYNALGVPIAAGVFYPFFGLLLSPMIAGLAMSLSSVSVISNAMRLPKVGL